MANRGPQGSFQSPRTLLFLQRRPPTQPTEVANEKQAPGVLGNSIHSIILLKVVLCQVHHGFIFWQKDHYAKWGSSHVHSRVLIYLYGPPVKHSSGYIFSQLQSSLPHSHLLHWVSEKPQGSPLDAEQKVAKVTV